MTTLRDVYEAVVSQGLLVGIKMEIYEILYVSGPATVGEIATLYKDKYPHTERSRGDLSKRVSELVAMLAVVKASKQRKCPTTNKKINVWKLSGKMPVKLSVKSCTPIKERIKRLEALEALEADVHGLGASIRFALHHVSQLGMLRQTRSYQDLANFYEKHF